jgi:hypothetical protein
MSPDTKGVVDSHNHQGAITATCTVMNIPHLSILRRARKQRGIPSAAWK